MIPPMAAVAAMAEPVMAAKNMQARILTMASPLGKCPIRASAKSTIRLGHASLASNRPPG